MWILSWEIRASDHSGATLETLANRTAGWREYVLRTVKAERRKVYGIGGVYYSICIICVYLLYSAGNCILEDLYKGREEGWKSIIPIYNGYVQYRLTWDVQYFWVALGLAVGGGILNSFGGIVGVIGSLALLGTALMNVVALYKLACAYGHGIGFTIGLFSLNPLFMLILGFGDSGVHGTAGVAEMKFRDI